jgi:glycine cleavage system H protein
VNDAVVDDPSLVNAEPFAGGWLIKIRVEGGLPADLLDRAAYEDLTA